MYYYMNDIEHRGMLLSNEFSSYFKNISLFQRQGELLTKLVKEPKQVVLKIILCQGLSGSGKSFWANEYVLMKKHNQTININKDDLRAMLHNGVYSRGNENFILNTRDDIVKNAIKNNLNVVISDTNLHPKHEKRMLEIANEIMKEFPHKKIIVEIKSFMDIPIETCIKQDLKRLHSVGESVILSQLKQYREWNDIQTSKDTYNNEKKFIPMTQDKNLQFGIIVDLDG